MDPIASTYNKLPSSVAWVNFDSMKVSLSLVLQPLFEHYYVKYMKLKTNFQQYTNNAKKLETTEHIPVSVRN